MNAVEQVVDLMRHASVGRTSAVRMVALRLDLPEFLLMSECIAAQVPKKYGFTFNPDRDGIA